MPSNFVTQYSPTFGAWVRLPCSKPRLGGVPCKTMLNTNRPREGACDLWVQNVAHTHSRLICFVSSLKERFASNSK